MSGELKNQRVAILATDGFEQSKLTQPLEMPRRNSAAVDIISVHSARFRACNTGKGRQNSPRYRFGPGEGRQLRRPCSAGRRLPIETYCAPIRVPFVSHANLAMAKKQIVAICHNAR
jgi:putative intracellular protease/amidase